MSAEQLRVTITRAYDLRDATVQMTIRYGSSMQKAAWAHRDEPGGEKWQRHNRAAQRQFWAIQRLAEAAAKHAVDGAS